MFLLISASCKKEVQEVVVVEFDPETTFTMKATEVVSLISDSGVTRYRANAKVWLTYDKAKEPYSYFPEGVYIERFDTLFQTVASIKADTAYYWEKQGLAKLIGNVKIQNVEGERFETSLLWWSEKDDRIWSDQFIRIEQEESILMGYGFESNQNMTEYKIFQSSGEFPVSDTPPDSTQQEQPAESSAPMPIRPPASVAPPTPVTTPPKRVDEPVPLQMVEKPTRATELKEVPQEQLIKKQ